MGIFSRIFGRNKPKYPPRAYTTPPISSPRESYVPPQPDYMNNVVVPIIVAEAILESTQSHTVDTTPTPDVVPTPTYDPPSPSDNSPSDYSGGFDSGSSGGFDSGSSGGGFDSSSSW